MDFDPGPRAVGLILLALALAALLTVGVPISVSKDTIEVKDWLGFAGNILGAIVTLIAAWIAWRAVQRQITAQRDATLLGVISREEDRLEAELHVIDTCIALVDELTTSTASTVSSEVSRLHTLGFSTNDEANAATILRRSGQRYVAHFIPRLGILITLYVESVSHLGRFEAIADAKLALRKEIDGLKERRLTICLKILPEFRRRIEAALSEPSH